MDSLLDWAFLLRLRAESRGLPHVHQKLLHAPHGASHCLPGSLILQLNVNKSPYKNTQLWWLFKGQGGRGNDLFGLEHFKGEGEQPEKK